MIRRSAGSGAAAPAFSSASASSSGSSGSPWAAARSSAAAGRSPSLPAALRSDRRAGIRPQACRRAGRRSPAPARAAPSVPPAGPPRDAPVARASVVSRSTTLAPLAPSEERREPPTRPPWRRAHRTSREPQARGRARGRRRWPRGREGQRRARRGRRRWSRPRRSTRSTARPPITVRRAIAASRVTTRSDPRSETSAAIWRADDALIITSDQNTNGRAPESTRPFPGRTEVLRYFASRCATERRLLQLHDEGRAAIQAPRFLARVVELRPLLRRSCAFRAGPPARRGSRSR